ncbi:hypothetical protein [[Phormidium] sp. ETS-05]|uniref:hypothetical protein n=1 Tax=[Phormidium] sp. ETS-05 TaxID=222819 RepID=UPI0018EF1F0F|nr:hypothetical protein [[Phormidium] sp. ETS-05]
MGKPPPEKGTKPPKQGQIWGQHKQGGFIWGTSRNGSLARSAAAATVPQSCPGG